MVLPTGGADDLIFQALVQDKTIEFFNNFDKRIDQLESRSSQGFSNVERGIAGIGPAIGIVGGIIGGLTTQLIQFGYQGAAALVDFGKNAIQLRARADTLKVVLNQVGASMGKTEEEGANTVEQLRDLGITTISATQSLIRMARANIDWAEAAKLARIAQNSAVVAGINSSQAFDRLVLGIQKMEPELLDELGITLQREQAYDRFAKTINKTVKELSIAEKQQAILDDIYRQSGVVAGVYESAMDTVGKKVTSTARYVEELQLQIGGLFQPAYFTQVEFFQTKLKEWYEWFQNNQDAVKDLTDFITKLTEATLNFIDTALTGFGKLPGLITNVGLEIAKIINYQFELGQDVDANAESIGQHFKELVVLISAVISTSFQQVGELVSGALAYLDALSKAAQGDVEGVQDALERARAAGRNFFSGQNYKENFDEAFASASEFFGIIESGDDAVDQLTDSMDELGDSVDSVQEALDSLGSDLQSLYDDIQKQIAEDAIKEARRAQEEALRNSFRREDIELSHQERLKRIRENYKDAQLREEEEHSNRLVDIERDYQRTIQDLQDRFTFEANELARQRDAVGLLRLKRRNKQDIEEADKGRQQQVDDEDRAFSKRLKDQKRNVQKELDQAEEARRKDYENLRRSLNREQQLRNLQARFQAEDRQRALQQELQDLFKQYYSVEGLTVDHLQNLLGYWSQYFGDLTQYIQNFNNVMAGGLGPVAYTTTPIYQTPTSDLSRRNTVSGQAGQVSRLLADPSRFMGQFGPSTPQVPFSSPVTQKIKKEITIRVEGDELTPLIRRQIVNVIGEVERNTA